MNRPRRQLIVTMAWIAGVLAVMIAAIVILPMVLMWHAFRQPTGAAAIAIAVERLEITLPPTTGVNEATIHDFMLVEQSDLQLSMPVSDLTSIIERFDAIYGDWSLMSGDQTTLSLGDTFDLTNYVPVVGHEIEAERDGGAYMLISLRIDRLDGDRADVTIHWFWDG